MYSQRFAAALVLLLAAVPAAQAELRVFACEPEWAALAEALGGKRVEAFSATTAQQNVHHIQARPSLIARLRRADLLVCSGAGLESGWLPALLRQAGNARVQPGRPGHFTASGQVQRLEVPARIDRALGDVHPEGNPHVHLDPRRLGQIATALGQRLIELDPANADHYRRLEQDFQQRWTAAVARWERQAAGLKGMPVVVHHAAWVYLFDWLGLRQVGALEPKPGIPPSAGHLAALKTRLARDPARVIIRAAYQDDRPAQWLARQTGLPVVELPFTVGGTPAAADLFGLFDDTIARLVEAGP